MHPNDSGARGLVVTHTAPRDLDRHETASHSAIARTLAGLKGFAFGGEYDAAAGHRSRLYFVPSDTLLAEEAAALGIRSAEDLFGGVVPFAFVATKAIVHPLVAPGAHAPRGWSHRFAERVSPVVLPGFAAFSRDDARRAALALLADGAVRMKPGWGLGGKGQSVIGTLAGLEPALAELDAKDLARYGVVVEPDLDEVTTYSIGQVSVAGLLASYCGTQRTTADNLGHSAFGGSDLLVVRGGYDALERLPLAADLRLALRQARAFDAATEEFAGFFASRRNYDAARGRDRAGRWRCGVLEQSWRIGGASGAEVAALAALRADPALDTLRARCSEAYGQASAPPRASVHFCGVDPRIGPITKYTVVEAYEPAR
jgi:hypothetical protein